MQVERLKSYSKKGEGVAIPSTPSVALDGILDKVKQIESNNGTAGLAVTCKQKGLSNDYGYNPPNCYPKGEDDRLVYEWWSKKLEAYDVKTAACIYNTGIPTDQCPYAINF